MVLEGRIPLSSYFADITLKKQLAVSALIEVQIIVADFILVSFSVLQMDARLLTAGPCIPLVPRMETKLVALHYPRSGVDRGLQ